MIEKPSAMLGISSSISLGASQTSNLLAFAAMREIEEIRRANLLAEAKRLGGDAALGRAIAADKNQIYQWVKAPPGKQRRNIKGPRAREAEQMLGRPRGWLDVDHSNEPTTMPAALSPAVVESRPKNNVMALRIAVQSFAVVLHRHAPDVAAEVAQDMIATADALEFGRQAFLDSVVGYLQGVRSASEAAPNAAPRVPTSSKSKRAHAG